MGIFMIVISTTNIHWIIILIKYRLPGNQLYAPVAEWHTETVIHMKLWPGIISKPKFKQNKYYYKNCSFPHCLSQFSHATKHPGLSTQTRSSSDAGHSDTSLRNQQTSRKISLWQSALIEGLIISVCPARCCWEKSTIIDLFIVYRLPGLGAVIQWVENWRRWIPAQRYQLSLRRLGSHQRKTLDSSQPPVSLHYLIVISKSLTQNISATEKPHLRPSKYPPMQSIIENNELYWSLITI